MTKVGEGQTVNLGDIARAQDRYQQEMKQFGQKVLEAAGQAELAPAEQQLIGDIAAKLENVPFNMARAISEHIAESLLSNQTMAQAQGGVGGHPLAQSVSPDSPEFQGYLERIQDLVIEAQRPPGQVLLPDPVPE